MSAGEHLPCSGSEDLPPVARDEAAARAAALREADAAFAAWARGYGVIAHDPLTQLRVHAMVQALVAEGALPDAATGWRRLQAADRIASAGM